MFLYNLWITTIYYIGKAVAEKTSTNHWNYFNHHIRKDIQNL